jgi:cation diffusion facilitator family transporter
MRTVAIAIPRSAHIHVQVDALTSVTAIVALAGGKVFDWHGLDPPMGLVGSAVTSAWAWGLLRDSSGILLDRTPADSDLRDEIRSAIESDGDAKITDLHVWQLGAGQFAAIVAIAAHAPLDADVYCGRMAMHEDLVHVTVEVRRVCDDADARKRAA